MLHSSVMADFVFQGLLPSLMIKPDDHAKSAILIMGFYRPDRAIAQDGVSPACLTASTIFCP